jgi:UDP-glucose 4-epimerase
VISNVLPEIDWVEGDLAQPAVCDQLLRDQDVLVHLAWHGVPLGSGSYAAGLALALIPTLSLLDAVKRRGGLHIVFASSGGTVYADRPDARLHKEDDPCWPTSPYGIQKLAAEQYLNVLCDGSPASATILRIATAYGWLASPGTQQGFVALAIAAAMRGEPVRLIGDPKNVRDFIHRNDIAEALMLATTRPPNSGSVDVINIGSGVGTAVCDVVWLIEQQLGRRVPVRQEHWETARRLPSHAVLNIERAAAVLNWKPKIPLRLGIEMGLAKCKEPSPAHPANS